MGENDNGKNDNDLKEWSAARDVLDKFDERLHDLRKYGFSFVTALIAAEAILKSYTSASTELVPDSVKFVVILVTLGLIVALRLFDQYYQNFQAAAAIRASILETRLGIELTGAISYMYKDREAWEYIDYIYVGFAILAGVFGVSILQPDSHLLSYPSYLLSIFVMLMTVGVAYGFVKFMCEDRESWRPIHTYSMWLAIFAGVFSGVFLSKFYLKSSFVVLIFIAVGFASGLVKFISAGLGFKPKVDWTVYPLVCRSGELVRITLTNMMDKNIQIQAKENVWRIEYQDGQPIYTKTNMNPINIGKEESYDWLWDTNGLPSEIYCVRPVKLSLMNEAYHVDHQQGHEWSKPPLRRKIYITPSEKKWWEIWK